MSIGTTPWSLDCFANNGCGKVRTVKVMQSNEIPLQDGNERPGAGNMILRERHELEETKFNCSSEIILHLK